MSTSPTYIEINCPTEKLIPFLKDFAHIPHIAVAAGKESNVHYLGFFHNYAVVAAREFARKQSCMARELPLSEVLEKYQSLESLKVIGYSDFGEFIKRP